MSKKSDIEEKWSKEVAERGFTQVPNYLLDINSFVNEDYKISPTETMILLQLISKWWKAEEKPYPSMRTISEKIGVSERQVQRAIKSLIEKEYITKERKKHKKYLSTNVYDLTPLVKILTTIAEEYVNKHPRKLKSENKINNKE